MIIFTILFSLLGFIELRFKPRLEVTEDYYLIFYGKKGRRDFIKFNKL